MKVEKNNVVSVIYSLRKDSPQGELIEECTLERPLEFVYGAGAMLPHFEKRIAGLQAAERFEFILSPQESYGEVNEEAIVEVSKDIFIIDGELRTDLLEVGATIPMRDNSGNPLNGTILKVEDSVVIIDFNHFLAGTTLSFVGSIHDVREATAEELAYGVHSHDGCGCGSGGGGCGSHDDDEGGSCCSTGGGCCG